MAFDWASTPWWAWALLVALAVIVAPLKMRILRRMLGKGKDQKPADKDE
jgi:hypothetical protein